MKIFLLIVFVGAVINICAQTNPMFQQFIPQQSNQSMQVYCQSASLGDYTTAISAGGYFANRFTQVYSYTSAVYSYVSVTYNGTIYKIIGIGLDSPS